MEKTKKNNKDKQKEEFLTICQGISSGIELSLSECENFSPHMIFKALCAVQIKEVIALVNTYLPGEENALSRDQLLKAYRTYFDKTGKRLQEISKYSLENIPIDDSGNPIELGNPIPVSMGGSDHSGDAEGESIPPSSPSTTNPDIEPITPMHGSSSTV